VRLAALALALLTVVPLGEHKLVVEQPARELRGSVLLVPGGATTLAVAPDGSVSSNNFVIRTRKLWQSAGYVTAYMDDPSDLREALARLRALARPVVLVSTSRGTIVAAQQTLRLGNEGPDLLVLTSPVTSGAGALDAASLRRVAIPVLVVANGNDGCPVSTSAGAALLAERLGARGTFVAVRSDASQGDACTGLSPHGFLGIESEVIAKIAAWIEAESPSR